MQAHAQLPPTPHGVPLPQVRQVCDALHRLAQPHLVRQQPVHPVGPQADQEAQPLQLVAAQGARLQQGGRRGEGGSAAGQGQAGGRVRGVQLISRR
jgi:hypothetical protein